MSAPAIIHNPHEAWLLHRRSLITASDCAAILGCDAYGRVAGDVYAEKVGLADPEEESWPMRWGNAFQDPIGREFARKTGRVVRMASMELPEITVHPALAWLGATLDGEQEGCDQTPAPAVGVGVLEAKATSVGHTWEDDEVPAGFQVQATVQMACAGKAWGSVVAFTSLRKAPRHQDIVFDPELFALMVPKLEEFLSHVRRREPPRGDPGWWSTEAIRRVFSTDDGAPIALPAEAMDIVNRWEDLKAEEKSAKEAKDELGDRLRLLMGPAPMGYLPDGSALTLKVTKETVVPAYTRAAFRSLRRTKAKGRK